MRFLMHFGRQVNCLSQSKRVILFLVEGVTDETAFGLVLSRLFEKEKVVRFKIIEGDITSRSGTNTQNCINRVVDQVKAFLAGDIYQKSDLLEVIHLVDLDGCFISKEHVHEEHEKLPRGSHIYYTLEDILTDHVDAILNRNEQKSEVLKKLQLTKSIYGKIPYRLFFFSCNLEHVFFNEANPKDEEKYAKSKEIEATFIENPKEFITFLQSKEIALPGDYDETWSLIQENEESLKRHSNFYIYFN